MAFCAIARPEEFFAGLRGQGVAVAATRSWRDHHRYTAADVAELVEMGRQHGADALVTTEKDLVRLTPELRQRLEGAAPLHAARLTVRLRDEGAAMEGLMAMLGGDAGTGPAERDEERMRK